MTLDNKPVYTGGCQCGAVRFRVDGAMGSPSICHCRMCQKAFGNFYAPLVSVSKAKLEWTRNEPKRFRSSNHVQRGFCPECGTPLTYEGDGSSHMDLTVGSFDTPGKLRPTGHSGVESRHDAWLDTRGLPETRTDQLPNIVNKWIEAVGKLPD